MPSSTTAPCSVCWLISAIVNLLILLMAALLLLPVERGGGPLTLIASADAEEGDLEMLMSAPYQSFYVILFSTSTRRMFDDESPSPTTIPATRENKERLQEWFKTISVGGGTDPREALFVAMSIAPDAIFLLSDGEFNPIQHERRKNRPFDVTLEAEELVEQMHRGYAPIHTFAYEDPESKQRMEVLAQITDGEYKYIPPNEQERPKPAPPRRRRR